MRTADELADAGAHSYRILKCQMVINPDEDSNCVPILEIHREGKPIELKIVGDRKLLPATIVDIAQKPGPQIDACVFNVEVYTAADPSKEKQPNQLVYLTDPAVDEALLTVAVTREGTSAVRLFKYHILDDGGIAFERRELTAETLGTLVYEIKGAFGNNERVGQ